MTAKTSLLAFRRQVNVEAHLSIVDREAPMLPGGGTPHGLQNASEIFPTSSGRRSDDDI